MKDNKNRKIRICLILLAPVVGGNESFMLNLVKKLDRQRFDILFVLFNKKGENAYLIPRDIAVRDIGMENIPGPQEFTNPKWILKLAKILRNFQPQIILSTSGYPNLMTIIAKIISQVKAFLIIREITTREKFLQSDKWHNFKVWIYGILYPMADLIVAPSEQVFKDLLSFIKLEQNRLKLIPNFINKESIQKNLEEPWRPEQFNLKMDKPVIISVARLTEEKGIDLGIRAFSQVYQNIPCNYWIVGNGPEENRLKRLAKELGVSESVHFLGYQKNPHIFLKHADIFLLPSRLEGFSNALLEAMYIGLPSVITKYDEFIETFIQEGINGMLAQAESADSIASLLERLLSDRPLRENIGRNAHQKINERYTDRIIIKEYENLFLKTAV